MSDCNSGFVYPEVHLFPVDSVKLSHPQIYRCTKTATQELSLCRATSLSRSAAGRSTGADDGLCGLFACRLTDVFHLDSINDRRQTLELTCTTRSGHLSYACDGCGCAISQFMLQARHSRPYCSDFRANHDNQAGNHHAKPIRAPCMRRKPGCRVVRLTWRDASRRGPRLCPSNGRARRKFRVSHVQTPATARF